MKNEVHPAIFVVIIVVVLAGAIIFGVKSCNKSARGTNSGVHMPAGPGIPVAH